MANPKRKISKSKRDKRRASWVGKLNLDPLTSCSNCSEPKVPHRACPACGYYNGQQIYTPKES